MRTLTPLLSASRLRYFDSYSVPQINAFIIPQHDSISKENYKENTTEEQMTNTKKLIEFERTTHASIMHINPRATQKTGKTNIHQTLKIRKNNIKPMHLLNSPPTKNSGNSLNPMTPWRSAKKGWYPKMLPVKGMRTSHLSMVILKMDIIVVIIFLSSLYILLDGQKAHECSGINYDAVIGRRLEGWL